MHKYHTPSNPGWTEPTLSSEQWENAYNDLKRRYEDLKLQYEAIKLERDKATEYSWVADSGNHGC